MDRDIYRTKLRSLEAIAASLPPDQFNLFNLVNNLTILILEWERIMLDRHLEKHPYTLAADIIDKTVLSIQRNHVISSLANPNVTNERDESNEMEDYHRELFQNLWTKFSYDHYLKRIDLYIQRLKINNLEKFIYGKKCIDFDCGHGNFALALNKLGASFVLGIDYGESSIEYCKKMTQSLGVNDVMFNVKSVYDCGEDNITYDFAIQNGVFHHLDNEEKAYSEVYRVLKPGAWFWIYTDGIDSIQTEIQDSAAKILKNYSSVKVGMILDLMGLSIGKRYHLGDSLQATYRHTSFNDFKERLQSYGFSNCLRLIGGQPTDTDGESLKDSWAKEKFGSGDIRVLV